ncbi:MAG: energy transducer TonB [Gemmatimonadota bacterium]
MFNNLLESKAVKPKTAGGSFASFVLHGLLIWGAVVATANAGEKLKEAKDQAIDFVEVKKDEPKPDKPEAPKEELAAPIVKGFQVLTAPINIPDVIPEIDLSRSVTNESDFTGRGVQGGKASGIVGGIVPTDQTQTYFEFQVEKPVVSAPGSSAPRYPEILKSAGVEGEVLAQFVVDTTGRAESGSFKVLKTSHELFALAVKNALPGMRFLPAEVGGKKVKQLVQQPFVFAIQK